MSNEILVAIDPGPTESAFIRWDGEKVLYAEILQNGSLLHALRNAETPCRIAVEMVACYGMPVGREVFETCLMIGRIQEIAFSRERACELVTRLTVKIHHCGTAKAKDSNIRQALIDKYGAPGTKKQPGATYGLKSHLWSALAIATYVTERTANSERRTNEISTGQRQSGLAPGR